MTNIEKLFNDFFPSIFDESFSIDPKIDIKENESHIEVKAELPGLTKDDISVELNDSFLTISGERKEEETSGDERIHRSEITYGKFERTINLITEAKEDEVKATFSDGMLTISIPKNEENKFKKIEIQ
jgi:HSP20 family protein